MNSLRYFYRSTISQSERRVYDRIRESWLNGSGIVRINGAADQSYDIKRIVECVALDNPKIFYVDYYSYVQITQVFRTTLRFDLFYNRKQIQQYAEDLHMWRDYVCREISPMLKPSEKYYLIYDYLSRQIQYQERGKSLSHTLLGCIPKYGHLAVCEGIAKAFKFFCDCLDLPAIVVTGNASFGNTNGGHAWNLVETERGYRHLDVTQGIDHAQVFGCAKKNGFLKRDQEMKEYIWDQAGIPACK